MNSISLCWLRRDLRLTDQVAFFNACAQSSKVALVFVFDTTILQKLKNKQDRRVVFIHHSLSEMNERLNQLGSELIVLYGDPKKCIPELAKQMNVSSVFINEDYEPAAKERDQVVERELAHLNIQLIRSKDQVVFSGRDVLKPDGKPYQVFTPYKRKWLECFKDELIAESKIDLKALIPKNEIKIKSPLRSLEDYGFEGLEIPLKGGEQAGRKLMRAFATKIKAYDVDRDFPALRGTSKLSVHLRFGTVSIRSVMRFCLQQKGKGPNTWLSELIWREFYFMILDQYPNVVNEAFKKQYRKIKWPGEKAHFKAWCDGQTGFPIVDAAMRQLNQTGFMHNRLRMIAASFLVKDLLIDWKWGEAYFAEKLLDFDLAANNGGWQWCASVGCDAQPYFRIFNPDAQCKRFDPENEFIKQWVPESLNGGTAYPEPIVDHKVQRDLAIELFKTVSSVD